jgi:Lrp/AsnC family transcriptional regulator for asnA, asnC and gidA
MRLPKLDKVDLRIIRLLQENGRCSYASIGREVGLSEAGVRGRVRRLLRQQVIRIVAVTKPADLGLQSALLGLTVTGSGCEQVVEKLACLPEVDYLARCAGRYDLLVSVICRDNAHLRTVLDEKVKTVPGVEKVEAFFILEVAKDTYEWPQPEK